jgi:hypothetical protein
MKTLQVMLSNGEVETFQSQHPLEDYAPRYNDDGSLTILKLEDEGTGEPPDETEVGRFEDGSWRGVREASR